MLNSLEFVKVASVSEILKRSFNTKIFSLNRIKYEELCEILLIALVLWFFITLIRAIVRRRMVRWVTGVLLSVCILLTAFVGIWGLNYYAPKMTERLGLPDRQYTPAELKEATLYYRDRANELAAEVERDENGVMVEYDFDTLAKHAGDGYKKLAERYDCFDGSTVRVKKMLPY